MACGATRVQQAARAQFRVGIVQGDVVVVDEWVEDDVAPLGA
jgi:hypothetical protein